MPYLWELIAVDFGNSNCVLGWKIPRASFTTLPLLSNMMQSVIRFTSTDSRKQGEENIRKESHTCPQSTVRDSERDAALQTSQSLFRGQRSPSADPQHIAVWTWRPLLKNAAVVKLYLNKLCCVDDLVHYGIIRSAFVFMAMLGWMWGTWDRTWESINETERDDVYEEFVFVHVSGTGGDWQM